MYCSIPYYSFVEFNDVVCISNHAVNCVVIYFIYVSLTLAVILIFIFFTFCILQLTPISFIRCITVYSLVSQIPLYEHWLLIPAFVRRLCRS